MIYSLLDYCKKAINYLKIRFKVKTGSSIKGSNFSEYQHDNFDHEDIIFVELQAEKSSEEDYRFGIYKFTLPTDNKGVSSNTRGQLHKRNDTNKSHEDVSNSTLLPANEKNSNSNIQLDISDGCVDKDPTQHPHEEGKSSIGIKLPILITSKAAINPPGIDDYPDTDWPDNGGFEPTEGEQSYFIGLFEDDNDDQNEEIAEEETDELSWDDFYSLDEFDELAHRGNEEDIQQDGKINREDRARQIAVEVLDKCGWDKKHLILLQQVFVENGWSAARVAIEREINNDLLPEELVLARKIRLFWSENEQYWITFHKIKYNAPFQQTDAVYINMSWLEALRIIRCFPSYPDIEEIYMFIDETYDYWYNSNSLHKRFKAFLKFLRYRTWLMRCALADNRTVLSLNPIEIITGGDYDKLYSPNISESQQLKEMGVELNPWPRPPDNIIKVIEESESIE